jgi:hypothetical protein
VLSLEEYEDAIDGEAQGKGIPRLLTSFYSPFFKKKYRLKNKINQSEHQQSLHEYPGQFSMSSNSQVNQYRLIYWEAKYICRTLEKTWGNVKKPSGVIKCRSAHVMTRIELEAAKMSPETAINTALVNLGKMDRIMSFLEQRGITDSRTVSADR